MDDELDTRLAVAKTVAGLLLHPDFRNAMSGRTAGGKRHVIALLESDTMKYVLERTSRVRGPFYMVVGDQKGRVIAMLEGNHPGADATAEDCDVNQDSEVGMLVDLLRASGRPQRCHMVKPDYSFQLVDDEQPVPAGLTS